MTILLEFLISFSIIAAILLIMVLFRAYNVLGDAKDVSAIAAKRSKELDVKIDQAETKLDSISDAIRGFVYSFDFIKMLRDKLMKEHKK